ncbi:hypothetical protein, partial [Janthinobacterium sp. DSP2-3-3]|uniref:hypothetical protein n=1 Tax=Janthinobacterium sp. DSP2-3-3 TaxID=2804596 RepID=UPI003CF6DEF5
TSFTASSRSSGVYVVERFICSPVGEVCQTRVSEKVRVPQRALRRQMRNGIHTAGVASSKLALPTRIRLILKAYTDEV